MENKYNELEKLNQLKANGTITDTEFEIQKQKILNNKSKATKPKGNKKVLKIIIGIIIAIALVLGGVYGFFFARESMTQNKISNINAVELEEKLIKELQKTPININDKSIKTIIKKYDTSINDKKDKVNRLILSMNVMYGLKEMDNPYNDFVTAFIMFEDNEEIQGIAIPCFKVESDNNGNFKNIVFCHKDNFGISQTIHDIIERVLKDEYNINMSILEYDDYNTTGINIYYTDTNDDFVVNTLKSITDKISVNNLSKSEIGKMIKRENLMEEPRSMLIYMTYLNNF